MEKILKWVLNKQNGELGLALSDLEQGQMVDSCEHDYELYGIESINCMCKHE